MALFPITERIASCVMQNVSARDTVRRGRLAVFMTPELYKALAKEHQELTYSGNMPYSFLGMPIRVVALYPEVLSCWVGELVYEEDLHEEDSGQDG